MTPPVSTPAAEATRADLREEPPVHTFCINPVGGPNIHTAGTDRFAAEPEVYAFMDWARSSIAALIADKAAAEARATAAEAQAATERARADRLAEALRPFARYAEHMPGRDLGGDGQIGEYYHEGVRVSIRARALEAARLILTRSDPNHPHGGDDADRT